ncbi:hypothetical protein LTR85_002554 [Meristemomyces frigidus]|nr:hypothetical protein LTR85_002554 [Meristemomyces frigidus]
MERQRSVTPSSMASREAQPGMELELSSLNSVALANAQRTRQKITRKRVRGLPSERFATTVAPLDEPEDTVTAPNTGKVAISFDFGEFVPTVTSSAKGTNIITSALDTSRYQELLAEEASKTEDQSLAELLGSLRGVGLRVLPKHEEEELKEQDNPFQLTGPPRSSAELEEEDTAFREGLHAAMLAKTVEPRAAPLQTQPEVTAFGRANQLGRQKRPSARATVPKSTSMPEYTMTDASTLPLPHDSAAGVQSSSCTAKPSALSRERSQGSRVDPANVFYQPHWTLNDAAQQIWLTIHGAHGACKHWTTDYTPKHFEELVRAKKRVLEALQALCRDIYWIAQFLQFGRPDMEMNALPAQMLVDVQEMLPVLINELGRLAEYEGCGWLHQDAVRPALDVQKMLADVQKRNEAKEQWMNKIGEAALERELNAALESDSS